MARSKASLQCGLPASQRTQALRASTASTRMTRKPALSRLPTMPSPPRFLFAWATGLVGTPASGSQRQRRSSLTQTSSTCRHVKESFTLAKRSRVKTVQGTLKRRLQGGGADARCICPFCVPPPLNTRGSWHHSTELGAARRSCTAGAPCSRQRSRM